MKRQLHRIRGVTLIELLVSLAVMAIMLALAVPSFTAYRQRAVLRGATDQLASVWGDARFEALRRNQMIKVVFVKNNAGNFCIGTATATGATDDTTCDCMPGVTIGTCNISNFPSDANEWRGVLATANPTMGDTDSDASGVVVLDPKRGNLGQASDVGTLSLRSPTTGTDYRLNFTIDGNGRAYICEPSAASNKLPQFSDRRC